MIGLDVVIIAVLLLLGILLILAEIFVLPGITLAAVGGTLATVGGLWYAYSNLGIAGGNIALVSGLVVFGVCFLYLIRSKTLNKIALTTNVNSTVADKEVQTIHPGDRGMTMSRLNPIGKVNINNVIVEAKTLGDFVDENVQIEVLKVYPNQLVVRKVEQ